MRDPKPVLPPAYLLEPCASERTDGTIGAELQRLADLVRCERDDKLAIKKWEAELQAQSM